MSKFSTVHKTLNKSQKELIAKNKKKSQEAKERRKAIIIKGFLEGKDIKQISKEHRIEKKTISNYMEEDYTLSALHEFTKGNRTLAELNKLGETLDNFLFIHSKSFLASNMNERVALDIFKHTASNKNQQAQGNNLTINFVNDLPDADDDAIDIDAEDVTV